MPSVGIHPPKTPVTSGSNGIAKNTIPNVCKMPGPPAPFVPTPLPNIAKSGLSPKNYSTSVKIDGYTVAIRGATFESIGDIASKGTGGGLISANTHGPAKFITPGSMTVKIEGKSVHLLGEPMLNNCGPSGSPPNTGATMTGVGQEDQDKPSPCPPHDLKCEPLTQEGEQARKEREAAEMKKRKEEIRKHTYDFDRAVESPGLYAPGRAQEALRLATIKQGQQEDAEYAQRVAQETKAKWTGLKYWCTKCSFSGDIDVFTESGIIKECKSNGLPQREQIEKYQIVGPALFGSAFKGIHIACPGNRVRAFHDSCEAQGLQGDIQPQPH